MYTYMDVIEEMEQTGTYLQVNTHHILLFTLSLLATLEIVVLHRRLDILKSAYQNILSRIIVRAVPGSAMILSLCSISPNGYSCP